MRSHRGVVTLVLIFVLSTVSMVTAQQDPSQTENGVHPEETYDGARENVNLATGNLFLSIPLLKLSGRNGLNYSISMNYNSAQWAAPILGGWKWPLSQFYPWSFARTGEVQYSAGGWGYGGNASVKCVGGYTAQFTDGSSYSFPALLTNCAYVNQQGGPGNPAPEYDQLFGCDSRGEGVCVDVSTGGCRITLKDGDFYVLSGCTGDGGAGIPTNTSGIIEDPNGNRITTGYGMPTSDTDTLARTITLSNSSGQAGAFAVLSSVQYKDSNGVLRTVTINYGSISISGCTFPTPPSGYTQPSGTKTLPTSIVLPNGLAYILQYDGCAELNKIVYPSGGYTRYVYDTQHYSHITNIGGNAVSVVEVIAKYVCRATAITLGATSTGTGNTCPVGEDVTSYAPSIPSPSTMMNNDSTSVTDPLGNVTTYNFTQGMGGPPPVEIVRKLYQGSSTLLRTINTSYTSSLPKVPVVQTTILGNGLQSQLQWDYATLDFVREKREYAYGKGSQGALVRKNDYTYGVCNRKTSEIAYDSSGNQFAKTTYELDNYTAGISASGAVSHDSAYSTSITNRCNVTAIQRWRNTDGATLTTRMQYDDAGNVRSTADPLSHITTTSYADVWGNGTCTPSGGSAAAYPTQITDPAGLITKHSYNSCTGTVVSATDPNNQVTTLSYDLMDRVIQATLPDTGQTSTCFSEVSTGSCYSTSYPLQIVATQKITSSTSKTSTTVLDGLARVSQTQVTDPDCSNGVTKADITYDAAEHKSAVSNPYCTTTDATYGVTTYQYDGLDRITKVIPPDGTSSSNNVSTTYDGLPINYSPLGNCTIVTDQVGNQRRSCSDALGRLQEVDEPGNVSVPDIPGTPGTGTVTISGGPDFCSFVMGTQVCEGGQFTVTVNGFQGQASWGQNSTASGVASSLASALNVSASPVTASANGGVVTMTSKVTGAASNYSLSLTSNWGPSQYFSGPSFTAALSGSTLTGGTDASPGNSGTGPASINSPWVTFYNYDVLNNLLRVDQKGDQPSDSSKWRTRTFAYNSLSQLLCAANPELAIVTCPNPDNGSYTAGTIRYAYDNDGNLTTKTSPKPNQTSSSVTVAATYTYEIDNRLTQKSYNDGTPTVKFAYEGGSLSGCTTAPPTLSDAYAKGRRTSMCDSSGATSWSHDQMGRTASEKRTIVGTSNVTNTITYAPYNLDGSLATITYPGTGKVITYTYSTAGRALSGKDNGSGINYAYSAVYAPFGGLKTLSMGSKPINISDQYNSRLQPTVRKHKLGNHHEPGL